MVAGSCTTWIRKLPNEEWKKSVKGYNSRFISVLSVIYKITIASSTRQPKSPSKNAASFFHLFAGKRTLRNRLSCIHFLTMGQNLRTEQTRFHELKITQPMEFLGLARESSVCSVLLEGVDIQGEILFRHTAPIGQMIQKSYSRDSDVSFIELHVLFQYPRITDSCRILSE